MGGQWKPVSSGDEIADALDLTRVGAPAIDSLLLAPNSDQYLRVEKRMPPLSDGDLGFLVPRTFVFFNVTACREFWGDAMVALTVLLLTHNFPVAVIVTACRKLYDNLTLLTPEEAQVVRAVIAACPGNPYEMPVAEADIRQVFRGRSDDLEDLLDALQSKGIVVGRRGGRVQLTY
jgi:hypothetical protein